MSKQSNNETTNASNPSTSTPENTTASTKASQPEKSEESSASTSQETVETNAEQAQPSQNTSSTESGGGNKKEESTQETKGAQKSSAKASASSSKSSGVRRIENGLNDYAKNMALNQNLETREIVRYQMRLRSVINDLFNLSGEEFDEGVKTLVSFIRKYRKSLFHERNLFRGFWSLKLSKNEVRRFEHLLNLFVTAADKNSPRSAIDDVDFNVLFRYVTDSKEQEKLSAFFSKE